LTGPGDILDVQVWDNKDLSLGVFVGPDGKISLPLVGQIQAGGRTLQQLQDELVKQYSKTVKVPSVAVILKEIKSRPVHLVRGFVKTGPIQLPHNDVTLIEIISLSGGIIPAVDGEKGFILRGNEKILVSFDKLLKGDTSQNITLQPRDSIVIPDAEMIYVQGEVRTPSAIKYTSTLTLGRAITQAGGTTNMAAPGRIELHRLEGEKKVHLRIDLDKILRSPEDNPDVKLRPGDIIDVPQRRF
jgi:polysaccharide export outer membrane protein